MKDRVSHQEHRDSKRKPKMKKHSKNLASLIRDGIMKRLK